MWLQLNKKTATYNYTSNGIIQFLKGLRKKEAGKVHTLGEVSHKHLYSKITLALFYPGIVVVIYK